MRHMDCKACAATEQLYGLGALCQRHDPQLADDIPPPPEGPPNTLEKEGDTTPRTETKRRLPKAVRACIESALKRADSKLRDGCSVDPKAQELMRIYLDTWVAGPLQQVLDWDDGKDIRDLLNWG